MCRINRIDNVNLEFVLYKKDGVIVNMNMSSILSIYEKYKNQCLYIVANATEHLGFITNVNFLEMSITIITKTSGQYGFMNVKAEQISCIEPFTWEEIQEHLASSTIMPEIHLVTPQVTEKMTLKESPDVQAPESEETAAATEEKAVPTGAVAVGNAAPAEIADDGNEESSSSEGIENAEPLAEKDQSTPVEEEGLPNRFQVLLKQGERYIQSVKASTLSANRLEWSLINGDKAQATKLLTTRDGADFGYTPDEWDAIRRRASALPPAKWGTKVATLQAQRLFQVFNTSNGIAEHFYTKLLFNHPPQGVISTLFQIYVTTKNDPPLIYLFHTHEDILSKSINHVMEYATALYRAGDTETFDAVLKRWPELLTNATSKSRIAVCYFQKFTELYKEASSAYPEANEFEQALIDGAEDEIKRLASNLSGFGYSEEEEAFIADKLEHGTLNLDPGKLAAAARLNWLQQNKNHQAEKCFVAALVDNPMKAKENLLAIYAEDDCKDLFLALADPVAESVPGFRPRAKYVGYLLEDGRGEDAQGLLKQWPELIVVPGLREKILQEARNVGNMEDAAYYENVGQEIFLFPALNALEHAVISGDQDAACQMLSDLSALRGMGYDEEQCEALTKKANGAFWANGTKELQKGRRLLQLQGNLHHQAEHFLWQAVSTASTHKKALHLLLSILVDEKRFSVVERLYQAYPTEATDWNDWLQVRLRMLEAKNDEDGVLALLTEHPELLKQNSGKWRELAERSGRADIVELIDNLPIEPNEFERAIIEESSALRLFATDDERLGVLGYTEKEIETAKKYYAEGNYMRGNDEYAIGMRLFQFQKNKNRQALRFFEQSKDSRATVKCFELYCEDRQWEKAVQYAESHPEILKDGIGHVLTFWFDALYCTERYSELLAEIRKYGKTVSNRQILQEGIALLKTGEDLQEILPALMDENRAETVLTIAYWEKLLSMLFEGQDDNLLLALMDWLLKKLLANFEIEKLDYVASLQGQLREDEIRWQGILSLAQQNGTSTLLMYWRQRGWMSTPPSDGENDAWLTAKLAEIEEKSNMKSMLSDNLIALFPQRKMRIQLAFLRCLLKRGETEADAETAADLFHSLDDTAKVAVFSESLASKLVSFPAFGDVVAQDGNIVAYNIFVSRGQENEAKLMEFFMSDRPRDLLKLPEQRIRTASDSIYECFVELLHRPVSETNTIRFWKAFVHLQTSDRTFASTLNTRETPLTASEKDTLCRLLLREPDNLLYWDSFLRFSGILDEAEIARARFWKSYFCGKGWNECMYSVRQMQDPSIAAETALQMMRDNLEILGALQQGQETVRWLLGKNYFANGAHSEEAQAFLNVIQDSLRVFGHSESMGGVLALLRNLAVQADLEKDLLAFCPQLLLEGIDGGGNGQGYALLAQILQKGDWTTACTLAAQLKNSGCTSIFADLMQDLMAELAAEPDAIAALGDYSDVLSLVVRKDGDNLTNDIYAEYIVNCFARENGKTGLAVLMRLRKYFPGDNMLSLIITYFCRYLEDEKERYQILYANLHQYVEGKAWSDPAWRKLVAAYWLLRTVGVSSDETQNPLQYFMEHCTDIIKVNSMQGFDKDCRAACKWEDSILFVQMALYGAACEDWQPFLNCAMEAQVDPNYTNKYKTFFNGMDSSLSRHVIHAYITAAHQQNERQMQWLESFSNEHYLPISSEYFQRVKQVSSLLFKKQFILLLPFEMDVIAFKLFMYVAQDPPEEILPFFAIMNPFRWIWESIWRRADTELLRSNSWTNAVKNDKWWHTLSDCCTLLPEEVFKFVYEKLQENMDGIDPYEWYSFPALTAFDQGDDARTYFLVEKGEPYLPQYKIDQKKKGLLDYVRIQQIKSSGRISGLFIQEERCLEENKLRPPHQIINMVAHLLTSKRVREYKRLLQYFSPTQKAIAYCVWENIAGRPKEALERAYNSVPETDMQGNKPLDTVITYLNRFADKRSKRKGYAPIQKAYQDVKNATEIRLKEFHHYILSYNFQLPKLDTTIRPEWKYVPSDDLGDASENEEVALNSEDKNILDAIFALPYVQEVMANCPLEPQPVAYLEETLNELPETEYGKRADLFAAMLLAYQERAVQEPHSVNKMFLGHVALMALQMGMAKYRQMLRNVSVQGGLPEAREVFFQAISCADKIPELPLELQSSIREEVFSVLLQYGSLRESILGHIKTRNARNTLCSVVKDRAFRKGLAEYFQVLEQANEALKDTDPKKSLEGIWKLRSSLQEKVSLRDAHWTKIKSKLFTQMDETMRGLNDTPDIFVDIFNKKFCQNDRRLYGEVQNRGGRAAEDVSLHVIFDSVSESSEKIYRVNSLAPRESVPFSVILPDTNNALVEYHIYVLYAGIKGEPMVNHGKVTIQPRDEKESFHIPLFDTNTPASITKETAGKTSGDVDQFVGRLEDVWMFKQMYLGSRDTMPSFGKIPSCMIYGLKRSGKTSLLKKAHEILEERGDILLCFVDAQRLNATDRVFVQEPLNVLIKQLERDVKLLEKDAQEKEMQDAESSQMAQEEIGTIREESVSNDGTQEASPGTESETLAQVVAEDMDLELLEQNEATETDSEAIEPQDAPTEESTETLDSEALEQDEPEDEEPDPREQLKEAQQKLSQAENLRAKWEKISIQENFNLLADFYEEFSEVCAPRHLILSVDEVEKVLDSLNHTLPDTSLFGTLRSILQWQSDDVHFLFCGSDKLTSLIIGGTYQQFFQNITQIHVRGMNRQDILEVIRKLPDEPGSCMRYYDNDVVPDLVWQHTGGMIWHVKLLMNFIARRIFRERRSIVYPSDVIEEIKKLIDDPENFRDLVVACTDEEKAVLKALARCQKTADTAVSFTQVKAMLPELKDIMPNYSPMSDESLRRALKDLETRTLIKPSDSEGGGGYQIFTNIYRLWLRGGEYVKKFVLEEKEEYDWDEEEE